MRFPGCPVECLLDVTHSLLHLAFHLLRSAFRLLGFVTRQFSELLLDFACYIFDSAFCLIAVHGVLLKRGSSAWCILLRFHRTDCRRESECDVGLRGKYYLWQT